MSRRRRQRFTATLQRPGGQITRQVILAYEGRSVQAHYESLGYVVLGVQVGDYRVAARNEAVKADGGYRVDQRALRAAIETLGIRLPVKIRYNSRVGSTQGNYRFRNGGHDIMLKTYHTAEQASSTLWHELTHALQAERSGGTVETWSSFTRSQRRYSYNRRPIEIEARAMSEKMRDVPLCFPTNR